MAGIVSLQPSFVITLSSKLHQTNLLQNVWMLPAAVRSVVSPCQHAQALCAGGFVFLAVALSTSSDRWSECERSHPVFPLVGLVSAGFNHKRKRISTLDCLLDALFVIPNKHWKWTRSLAKDWFPKMNRLLFLSSELELELVLKRLLFISTGRGCCWNTGKSSLVWFTVASRQFQMLKLWENLFLF